LYIIVNIGLKTYSFNGSYKLKGTGVNMIIKKAELNDLPEVLELQKTAYLSEAQLLNNFSIPPLTQTLNDLTKEYENGIVLKAMDESAPETIIGSVRGYIKDNTLYIGKLMVSPLYQNRGIGKLLLKKIEEECPDCRYELFTSTRSEKNISIYEKSGYHEFKREAVNDKLSFVYLEK
jgi:GNAT superfamily N-acetyltransferase